MAITSARMQIKRGNEVDFDAEQMLVGEWALSTDERIVRICVAPNVCIRMATYDAFEVDMAQIEEILEECQTIEDAVRLINSQVSDKLNATIEYTNQAKQYRDETEQFRNEVESMVDIGIATTEKAGIVRPDGITIRVDEDGTIHADNGTVDYNELENKPQINGVELSGSKSLSDLGIASADDLADTNSKVNIIIEKAELNIKNSAKGNNLHLTDSANGKFVDFSLYGKAEQNGEPTPDNPIEITVSGSDGSVEVVSCGKNLYNELTLNKEYSYGGVTLTKDAETGNLTISGTATANNNMIMESFTLPTGTYYMHLRGNAQNVSVALYNKTAKVFEVWNSGSFTLSQESDLDIRVQTGNGSSPSGTFKIQIEKGSSMTEYEPYTETTSTIPTPNGLCGIKVSSGGNYVDENGQQWICDEIVKYADGSGKRIERIKHYSLAVADMNNSEDFPGWLNVEDLAEIFGSGRNEELTSQLLINVGNRFSINTDSNLIFLRKSVYNLTQTEWKTKYPDLIVEIYALRATPIITDLSAEEIAEIEKLYTFYPVTNISNDADCGMSITYMADAKNYIDNRLALIESAMLNNI